MAVRQQLQQELLSVPLFMQRLMQLQEGLFL
jgi:hypothetical protein